MRPVSIRRSVLWLAILAAVVVGLIAAEGQASLPVVAVRLGPHTEGRAIPAGFVGLSLEYPALLAYAGADPRHLDPVFEQLVRNLSPGRSPQLRIGGDSTDRTWWPVPGMARPGGVTYSLSPRWAGVAGALARSLRARLILGINLEADSRELAVHEARELVAGVGAASIQALEVGNEPELYGSFPWYQAHGHAVRGRPHGYGPADFAHELVRLAPRLPRLPLAGPATGGPRWTAYFPRLLADEPRLALLTAHHYGTRGCLVRPTSPQYHSIANLLSSQGIEAPAGAIAPYAWLRRPVRLDELNSVNCGGVSGISDRFASALWAVDALFQLVRSGAAGVNFHTFPGARYQLFAFHRMAGAWSASVKPVYYGMLLFAQAAAPGSRLLTGSGPAAAGLDVWALRTPAGRVRVVLVNSGASREVELRLPGAGGGASLEWLRAPSLTAGTGVTLGGRSFAAATATGRLTGALVREPIAARAGSYTVRLPADSAATLTRP